MVEEVKSENVDLDPDVQNSCTHLATQLLMQNSACWKNQTGKVRMYFYLGEMLHALFRVLRAACCVLRAPFRVLPVLCARCSLDGLGINTRSRVLIPEAVLMQATCSVLCAACCVLRVVCCLCPVLRAACVLSSACCLCSVSSVAIWVHLKVGFIVKVRLPPCSFRVLST